MRDPARIEQMCDKIKELWEMYPDLRFGQLVVDVLGRDPFYVEDGATLKAFQNWIDKSKKI